VKLIHSILSHWDAEEVDALMNFHQQLDSDVVLLLAYGGPEDEFQRIAWRPSIYLADPKLRGPTDQQNYASWIAAVWQWAQDQEQDSQAFFFTETDHPMLRAKYGRELLSMLKASGTSFLGKSCSNRENSNSYFYLRYRSDPALRALLRQVSGVEDSPIYECLATGMLFEKDLLGQVVSQTINISVFTEVIVPSVVRALGCQPGCFDLVSDFMNHVRYRPSFSADDVIQLIDEGAWCCHPFKERAKLPDIIKRHHATNERANEQVHQMD
jgi:hypothetical protein